MASLRHSTGNRIMTITLRGPRRAAGILLHPTSLPGRYGIGDLGDELVAFLDWMASAGQRLWQILPLNPPGFGYSPYGCLSSFAGNPLLISPQRLLQQNLLPPHAVDRVPPFPDDHVDFENAARWKWSLLRASWEHFHDHAGSEIRAAFASFETSDEHRQWLDDFALFMAIKQKTMGAPWWTWDPPLANRDEDALDEAWEELHDQIRFQKFVQFLFFRQWQAVRDAAAARGISIIGDLPIYVAHDSADVWSHREIFDLEEDGQPRVVAGVPPDYFSATGQRWGNPLYRWDVLRESGYRWWIDRIRANLAFCDLIRIDHFRGFAAYWEIPAGEPTAIHGRWLPGPGKEFFDAVAAALGDLPLLAEDLGFITDDVQELRIATGMPGMKVLQFGFSDLDSPHLPHHYERNTAVYTGTHDNDTARGWFDSAKPHERQTARDYLGPWEDFSLALIRAAYTSVARIAIVPAQDVLRLGSEARMNRPGADKENWSWRMLPGALTGDHAHELRRLAEITGRLR
ncbi:MAG TPA: 4-alpha-glucanotransferase [Thermoanaerobaculia bacterium]|nr:4-alpha-glucanotransferase [Thermoanaerobaculia bacterium]